MIGLSPRPDLLLCNIEWQQNRPLTDWENRKISASLSSC
jgi:hypothetical protein